MLRRFIIFLARRRLGLKKYEGFRFEGQYSKDNWYFFTEDKIMKVYVDKKNSPVVRSDVSFNWILDEGCKIRKAGIVYEQE